MTKLETVTSFKCLGSVITDEGSKPEILSRIAQKTTASTRLKPDWNERSISLSSKIQVMRSLVTCIFMYACESLTLTAELQRRIQAMEMRCYRKILRISYKDDVANEEVCVKIQQAIRPHEDLLTQTSVVWSCLLFTWSGQNHLARHNERRKNTMQTGRGRKTTSWNGQAWSSASPRGQWRTGKNGGNWLWNHLWYPNDPCG